MMQENKPEIEAKPSANFDDPLKTKNGGPVRLLLAAIGIGLAAIAIGAASQWMWGAGTRMWSHPEKSPAKAMAIAGPGSGVLVIDSGHVAATLLSAAQTNPALASLKARPSALGSLVGNGIHQAAAKYAAEGYVVLDSSAVLGVPVEKNITAAVTSAVMQDAKSAASLLPAEAPQAQESPTPASSAPGAGEDPQGRLP